MCVVALQRLTQMLALAAVAAAALVAAEAQQTPEEVPREEALLVHAYVHGDAAAAEAAAAGGDMGRGGAMQRAAEAFAGTQGGHQRSQDSNFGKEMFASGGGGGGGEHHGHHGGGHGHHGGKDAVAGAAAAGAAGDDDVWKPHALVEDDHTTLGNLTVPHKYCSSGDGGHLHPGLTDKDVLLHVEVPKATSTLFSQFLRKFAAAETDLQPRIATRAGKPPCCLIIRCGPFHDSLAQMQFRIAQKKIAHDQVIPVTFLREPVSRVLSEYKEWKAGRVWHTSFAQFSERMSPDMTLEEWVRHPDCPAHNRQTWMFATNGPKGKACSDYTKFATMWRGYYDGREDFLAALNSDQSLYDSALENLMGSFFGLSEFLHESLELFLYTFDATAREQDTYRVPHTGSDRKNHDAISPELEEEIRQRNHLDVMLYETALHEFHRRVTHMHECEPSHAQHEDGIDSHVKKKHQHTKEGSQHHGEPHHNEAHHGDHQTNKRESKK